MEQKLSQDPPLSPGKIHRSRVQAGGIALCASKMVRLAPSFISGLDLLLPAMMAFLLHQGGNAGDTTWTACTEECSATCTVCMCNPSMHMHSMQALIGVVICK